MAGSSVAVAGYELLLSRYEPLPILGDLGDWITFIERIKTETGKKMYQESSEAFLSANILSGCARDRILDHLTEASERVFS